jgi:hypothetical protein
MKAHFVVGTGTAGIAGNHLKFVFQSLQRSRGIVCKSRSFQFFTMQIMMVINASLFSPFMDLGLQSLG